MLGTDQLGEDDWPVFARSARSGDFETASCEVEATGKSSCIECVR